MKPVEAAFNEQRGEVLSVLIQTLGPEAVLKPHSSLLQHPLAKLLLYFLRHHRVGLFGCSDLQIGSAYKIVEHGNLPVKMIFVLSSPYPALLSYYIRPPVKHIPAF
jgi:hypothetical protein